MVEMPLVSTAMRHAEILVRDRQERRPDPRNNVEHWWVESTGESPTRKFSAVFAMEDGSFQSFDGRVWKNS
jgi:hypothetical protein